jgi:hypothetical protein
VSDRTYMATIAIEVVIRVPEAGKTIGGINYTADETAAWDADSMTGYLWGEGSFDEKLAEAGHYESGSRMVTAEVTELRPVVLGGAVEPKWDVVAHLKRQIEAGRV